MPVCQQVGLAVVGPGPLILHFACCTVLEIKRVFAALRYHVVVDAVLATGSRRALLRGVGREPHGVYHLIKSDGAHVLARV